MNFSETLTAFAERQLTVPELMRALNRALADAPDHNEHLRMQMETYRRDQGLPLAIYEALSARLDEATIMAHPKDEAATMLIDAEPTVRYGMKSDADATRYAPATSEATVLVTQHALSTEGREDIDTRLQEQLAPGMTVKGRFVLEEILGAGGMGVVFRARDLRKEEAQDRTPHIAIKVLGSDFKHHPDSLKALQREAKKAQTLAHPNIVSVYDFDRDGHTIFMTMELLEGQGLDKVIAANKLGGLPMQAALPLIEGIAQALAYAHKKNIIHSDLKPSNVYLTKDNVAKVLDFGIARARRDGAASAVEADPFDAGTLGALSPTYASCEMIEGREPDPRDDIYALGCIAYELLSGHHPFDRKSAVAARDAGMQAAAIPGLTRRQGSALRKALAFKREERAADVLTFAAELTPRKFPWAQAVAGVMLAAGVLGGWAYYSGQNERLMEDLGDEWGRLTPTALTPIQETSARELLEMGGLYVTMGQYAAPPGDNAFDVYQRVLEMDPRNETARDGVRKIADYYESQARIALDRRDYAQTKIMIDLGLYVRPAHKALRELQEELRNRQDGRP